MNFAPISGAKAAEILRQLKQQKKENAKKYLLALNNIESLGRGGGVLVVSAARKKEIARAQRMRRKYTARLWLKGQIF